MAKGYRSEGNQPIGDIPADPARYFEGERPLVSEDVVAAYVVDTVTAVPGVARMHGSAWEELSQKMHAGATTTKGVAVRSEEPGSIELDIHVDVVWGVNIPELASRVEDAVRNKIGTLLDVEVRAVMLFVEEIESPARDTG